MIQPKDLIGGETQDARRRARRAVCRTVEAREDLDGENLAILGDPVRRLAPLLVGIQARCDAGNVRPVVANILRAADAGRSIGVGSAGPGLAGSPARTQG